MLTKVILEGPMGKALGREWELAIDSPAEALRLIDANRQGVFAWIRANLKKYATYRITCEYEDGRTDDLDIDTYTMLGKIKKIRFAPLIEGAGGGWMKVLAGAALFALGATTWAASAGMSTPLMSMGASMMVGGVVQLLSPRPVGNNPQQAINTGSYYFDGPVNTTVQGVPVQLVYGRVLIGSHTISAALNVDEIPYIPPTPSWLGRIF